MDPDFAPKNPTDNTSPQLTDTPLSNTSVSPAAPPVPTTVSPAAPSQPTLSSPRPKRRKARLIALVGGVLALVLLGGAAAAYFAVIVPNKPENVLKKAFTNFSNQSSVSLKGKVDTGSVAGMGSANLDIAMLHVDPSKKTMLLDAKISTAGASIPVEARYLDKNIYIKVGSLDSLMSAYTSSLGESSKEVSDLVKFVDTKVSNQWLVIDTSVFDTAQVDCSLQGITSMLGNGDSSEQAAKLLSEDQYKFFNIQNTSKEDVDNQPATKFELSIDSQKLAAYTDKLQETLPKKASADCDKELQKDEKSGKDAIDATTVDKFIVWVDKSDTIKRVQLAFTAKDNETVVTPTVDVTFLDQPVTVDKPANAKPIMQLYQELLPALGLGGEGLSTPGINPLSGSLSL